MKTYIRLSSFLLLFTLAATVDSVAQIGQTVYAPSGLTDAEYYALGYQTGCLIAQGNYGDPLTAYTNTINYAQAAFLYHYLEGVVDGYSSCQSSSSGSGGTGGGNGDDTDPPTGPDDPIN